MKGRNKGRKNDHSTTVSCNVTKLHSYEREKKKKKGREKNMDTDQWKR